MINKPFKILLFGDQGVGKTEFIRTWGDTDPIYNHSTGVSVCPSVINKTFCPIIDILGKKITPLYANANAIIIMYDVTSADSIRNVDNWRRFCSHIFKDAAIILVGNKTDCYFRIPLKRRPQAPLFEISALTGTGIADLKNYLGLLIGYLRP